MLQIVELHKDIRISKASKAKNCKESTWCKRQLTGHTVYNFRHPQKRTGLLSLLCRVMKCNDREVQSIKHPMTNLTWLFVAFHRFTTSWVGVDEKDEMRTTPSAWSASLQFRCHSHHVAMWRLRLAQSTESQVNVLLHANWLDLVIVCHPWLRRHSRMKGLRCDCEDVWGKWPRWLESYWSASRAGRLP